MHEPTVHQVFVYGTLKRGQVRESAWPYSPTSVRAATVRGRLFDLGEYPALLSGDDVVAGELWEFDPLQMSDTLSVLDEIEGFRDGPDDLYRRITIRCELEGGGSVRAFSYRYANHELPESMRIASFNGRPCVWPPVASPPGRAP